MKHFNLRKIALLLSLTCLLLACNDDVEVTDPLDLTSIDLELNIDFSKGKFDLSKDNINILYQDITEFIYNDENVTKGLSIKKFNNELIINTKIDLSSRGDAFFSGPCETKKKTCRSKQCVKDTLTEILGDGSRDVDIKYRRNTFSVTIEYTYKDC